jgi:hypothetical protein
LDKICATKSTKPQPFSSSESSVDNGSGIVYLGTNEAEEVDKYSILATLTNDIIESPTGWLENTVIQAHVLLKKMSPDIQGFQ